MTRLTGNLKSADLERLGPGRHADGGGLCLNVKRSKSAPDDPEAHSRTWAIIFPWQGKQVELGLGRAVGPHAVTLQEARARNVKARELLSRRPAIDPRVEWKPTTKARATFLDAAKGYLAKKTPEWRNAKHAAQVRMLLVGRNLGQDEGNPSRGQRPMKKAAAYAEPLHKLTTAEINTEHVLSVLRPLWARIPETASRLRQHIEGIIEYGRPDDDQRLNPARWRGHLANKLSNPKKAGKQARRDDKDAMATRGQMIKRGNHAAMPYREVAAFVTELRRDKSVATTAIEFGILTTLRSNEIRLSRWAWVDPVAETITVPATITKTDEMHVVPLSNAARKLLDRMKKIQSSGFIFPGAVDGMPIGVTAMSEKMRKLTPTAVLHGFRSSFRDWAGDEPTFRARSPRLRWRTRSVRRWSRPIAAETPSRSAVSSRPPGPPISSAASRPATIVVPLREAWA
jgi:integrase